MAYMATGVVQPTATASSSTGRGNHWGDGGRRQAVTLSNEPGTGFRRRFVVDLLKLLLIGVR